LESIKPNNIKIFERKPLKGGIPATEKNINTNENDHKLLNLKKFDRLDKNKGVAIFPVNC
tara:strand:+ start:451 stop:630 length:180 start_codon:yes stop_codon:yes gene_type:complete